MAHWILNPIRFRNFESFDALHSLNPDRRVPRPEKVVKKQRIKQDRCMVNGTKPSSSENSPLRMEVINKHVQRLLTPEMAVIADTGDSWFWCQKLELSDGCGCSASPFGESSVKDLLQSPFYWIFWSETLERFELKTLAKKSAVLSYHPDSAYASTSS